MQKRIVFLLRTRIFHGLNDDRIQIAFGILLRKVTQRIGRSDFKKEAFRIPLEKRMQTIDAANSGSLSPPRSESRFL